MFEPALIPMKRKRFQFSITDLLLVTILTGIGTAISTKMFGNITVTLVTGGLSLVVGLYAAHLGTAEPSRIWKQTFVALAMLFAWMLMLTVYTNVFVRTRMAPNEVAAAASCKAFAEAQDIYFRTDYNCDGVKEYAIHLGGNNSLYETTAGAAEVGMIDRTFADAEYEHQGAPKAGYHFRVLTAQGKFAAGGAKSYIDANGRMTKGYALVAFPANYPNFYTKTYIINNAGTIYEADLGRDTESTCAAMQEFDPDPKVWVVSE